MQPWTCGLDLLENFLLQIKIFDNRFNDKIGLLDSLLDICCH